MKFEGLTFSDTNHARHGINKNKPLSSDKIELINILLIIRTDEIIINKDASILSKFWMIVETIDRISDLIKNLSPMVQNLFICKISPAPNTSVIFVPF